MKILPLKSLTISIRKNWNLKHIYANIQKKIKEKCENEYSMNSMSFQYSGSVSTCYFYKGIKLICSIDIN